MFVYKRLKASDASITAFEAHKEYNITKDNTASLGITLVDSQYSSASKDSFSQFNLNNELEYFQLNHLFYKDPVFNLGNLNGGINYTDQEKRLYDKATILSISQKNFGSGIQKGTVNFNSTYVDDSKGNLYNTNESISDYPKDKERIFYVGPVKGFTRTDLTKDLYTGISLVNPPTSYNAKKLDDSLYSNTLEYINCTFDRLHELNCTGVQLENGYIKAPHKNDYNFGDEDFTISFYYKTTNAAGGNYIIAKSKSQTAVKTPASNTDSSLKNTHGSSSLLQAVEIDAGNAFPFEISIDRQVIFERADQINTATHTSTASGIANNTLYHIACVKTGSNLKIYVDGVLNNGTGTDTTTGNCKNQADLYVGTNPDISQNKLDNTNEGVVSQLMIWNRGLSLNEVKKVSSSIDGTPYVGNVFYENGLITLTSPTNNSGDFTSNNVFNVNIALNPTDYTTTGGGNIDITDLTFSGSSFTFFNEQANEINLDVHTESGDVFQSISYNSDQVLFSNTDRFGPISMSSAPSVALNTYAINPIFTETNAFNLNTFTLLNNKIDIIPGAEGTGSGEQGTDSDSITEIINHQTLGEELVLRLAENQTVTQSFDITPVSSTTPFDEKCYDEEGGGGDFPLTDANLVAESLLKFGSNNEGGTIQGAVLTGGNAGEIAITGSNGFVSFFTNNNNAAPLPKIETNHSTPIGTTTFPAYVYFGNGHTNTFSGVTVTGTNIQNATFPGEGAYYTNTDAVNATNEKFVLGPAANNGTFFNKLYKAPGTLTFRVTAGAYRATGATVTAQVQFRYKPSGGSFGSWTNVGGTTNIGTSTTSITQNHNRISTYVNNGDEYEYRIKFDKTSGGFGQVFLNPSSRAFIFDQSNDAGFYDRVELETDVANHPITLSTGDLIKYTVSTIRGFNTYNPSDHDSGDVQITKAHTKGTTGNGKLNYDVFGQDNNLTDIFVTVGLYKYNGSGAPATLVADHQLSSNTTLEEYFTVISGGSYYFKLYLSDSNGNIVFHPGSQGLSIRQIKVEKWIPTTGYVTDTAWSTTIPDYQEFTLNSNDDEATLNQSITFDDNSVIQYGTLPTAINNIISSNIYFSNAVLITSSLGATASFDRGNYISGSASIDITGTKGIYEIDKMVIRTTPATLPEFNGFNHIGNNANSTSFTDVDTNRKARIQTKLNGNVIDTKYIQGNTSGFDLFLSEQNKVKLGVLDNTDNVSFEFTVVDSSNNVDKVFKEAGFAISDIVLKKITSSNTVTRTDNAPFEYDIDFLTFSSSHVDTGDSEMPFNIGPITASIASGQGGQSLILSDYYLITSSFTSNATSHKNGPFIISASFPFEYRAFKDYFFKFEGTINQANDGGSNEGTGIRVLDANDNILSEIYNESGNGDLSNLNFTSSFTTPGTGKILMFVSGASSILYPNGIVTSSNSSFTGSYTFSSNITATARSASRFSSGVTVTSQQFTEGYASSSILQITSSHTPNAGGVLLNTGKFTVNISERTDAGNIKVNVPLYITSSAQATGSHPTQSFVGATINANPINPFITDSETNSNMLGGTFTYTDPDSGDTQTLTITNIISNPDGTTGVEVNNGNGIFQVGTFEEQNPQEVTVNYNVTTTNDYTLVFKNTHLIFENEFHCTVDEDEFNFTLNPTARKNQSINTGDLANFATGSNFKPYVTTIGLYNEEGELLVIGKMAQPIRMSDETDTTFVVRYDT